jgi:hypothetical protein
MDVEAEEVAATARLFGDGARFRETEEDGVLSLETNCPRHLFSIDCRVDYTIVLPPGVELAVTTVDGEVDVYYEGRPNALEVATQEGDVALEVPAGAYDLRAISATGDVDLTGVESAPHLSDQIVVQTESGGVSVYGW